VEWIVTGAVVLWILDRVDHRWRLHLQGKEPAAKRGADYRVATWTDRFFDRGLPSDAASEVIPAPPAPTPLRRSLLRGLKSGSSGGSVQDLKRVDVPA